MDKLTILKYLEQLADKLRALGFHPVTRVGRHVLHLLIGDITVRVDDLTLSGSMLHRGYLRSLREGKHEAYMAQLFKGVLRPGMTVCDIGSYIGYYALLAAQRLSGTGKVFAFEPDPHNFTYLLRNIKLNNFEDCVVPIQKAVMDRGGRLPLYIYEGDRSRSSLFWRGEDIKQTIVECVCLDEFFSNQPGGVDVVKIDIEGGELHALKGMERVLARSLNTIMFVECNPKALRAAGGSAEELIDTLRHLGFTVKVINEETRELQPVTTEIEHVKYVNLFCQRG